MHVQAGDGQTIAFCPIHALADLPVPDAVFRLLAAGVGLLAVAVAEAGIDPQGDVPAGSADAKLVDHVGRTAVDVDVLLHAQVERFGVEDVGRVDDGWGRHSCLPRADRNVCPTIPVAGGQGAANLAGADGIDQGAFAADQVHNGKVRTGLLGVADDVEGGQVGDPPADHGGIVDERRRAEPPGQLDHGHAGDFSAKGGHAWRAFNDSTTN